MGETRSYAPEVVADSSGEFCGNGLNFETREEAERWVADLKKRWILVKATRVVESPDPANSRYDGDVVTPLPVAPPPRMMLPSDESGYDLDDPKHPTYHERMSDLYDSREGK